MITVTKTIIVTEELDIQVCVRGETTLHFQVRTPSVAGYRKFDLPGIPSIVEAVRAACTVSDRTSFYGSDTRYAEIVEHDGVYGIWVGFTSILTPNTLPNLIGG